VKRLDNTRGMHYPETGLAQMVRGVDWAWASFGGSGWRTRRDWQSGSDERGDALCVIEPHLLHG